MLGMGWDLACQESMISLWEWGLLWPQSAPREQEYLVCAGEGASFGVLWKHNQLSCLQKEWLIIPGSLILDGALFFGNWHAWYIPLYRQSPGPEGWLPGAYAVNKCQTFILVYSLYFPYFHFYWSSIQNHSSSSNSKQVSSRKFPLCRLLFSSKK